MNRELPPIWRQVRNDIDPRYGGECIERQCVQHDRLTSLTQRPNQESEFVTTYHVDGLAQIYHTPGEALQALRENTA